ncbi:hypothetical protein D9619_009345 [Psilocybe cf. subviscida]|uniref:Alpha-1,4 glucan phosphorylase n=1 Tax=Psilocybe cf. subviscida TaxID=2480587 RepID=A0A8H5BUI2_9AGAR|nr:hypothetical protein D9619_009345 [Psilocybe cf. subviscida]
MNQVLDLGMIVQSPLWSRLNLLLHALGSSLKVGSSTFACAGEAFARRVSTYDAAISRTASYVDSSWMATEMETTSDHLRPLDPLYQNLHHVVPIEQKCPSLAAVVKSVASDVLGNAHVYKRVWTSWLLNTIRQSDYYLVTDDFDSYIAAPGMVDEAYREKEEWIKKFTRITTNMDKFSSDRTINEYAESYWNLDACPLLANID